MRVLYDISTLGFAHFYQQSRGGAYRVDFHISQGLAASDQCELIFCANHSSVAYHGAEAFVRGHERLRDIPLIGPSSGAQSLLRGAASATHRRLRNVFGSNVLPSAVRRAGQFLDRRLHPRVNDAGAAVDIFHSSASAPLPPVASHTPRRFLTIYDLAFIRFPAIYGAAYRECLETAIRSVGPGDHVITISSFVRDELAGNGVATRDRIHVVPLAADPSVFYRCEDPLRINDVRRKYRVPDGPYVLGVNTPDLRKNVPHAIHAFARACAEAPAAIGSFVLTGHPGPGSDLITAAIEAHPELHEKFVLTGYVPDEDLAPLYTGARVFVYSSLYEGFGLPPLEAMQCGTPVIASSTSSMPEVVGDGGILVAPDDLDALPDAILSIAEDTELHGSLQQRAIAQASRFSWERSTEATLSAYRRGLHG